MKKIREKFTIVERLLFLLVLIIIIIIMIPIISDKIEKPKKDKAKKDAETYVEIVNQYLKDVKENNEELFNEIIKYNSVSKFCSITDEEAQELKCGDTKLDIKNKNYIIGQDSIIYFSKEGNVEGYKIIIDGYKVSYPNSKGLTSIKKYTPKKEDVLSKEV